ncbi:MAG: metal ABC transporter ATP-binding protein [Oscillospiraceae bacterium]|nr:metal ABC transporter ATP-binding protein [Oscillospiraceae bacterium]
MAQITCKHLTLGYESKEILSDLSFNVEKGNYLCIVGENGSGKTTLVKALLGLHRPMSGEISTGDELKFNEIGYLPQQTMVQKDFPASVEEIVLSGCRSSKFSPFYSKQQKKLAAENMVKMNIHSLRKRCYRELSGGQQQRVLLARALCATKKLLLLDEPVSGLDPLVTDEMYKLIDELNKNDKITIVMISHDIPAAIKYASHILHIGNKIFFGTAQEYAKSDFAKHFNVLREVAG